MHIGVLGRPLRPPRWGRRTRRQGLTRAVEIAAVLVAVVAVGNLGMDRVFRSPQEPATAGPGPDTLRLPPVADTAVAISPSTGDTGPAEAWQPREALYANPQPDHTVAPSTTSRHASPSKLKHVVARVRSRVVAALSRRKKPAPDVAKLER